MDQDFHARSMPEYAAHGFGRNMHSMTRPRPTSTTAATNVQQRFEHIGIIGKRGDTVVSQTIATLCEHLRARDRAVTLDSNTAQHVSNWTGNTVPRTQLGAECDLVVVVGGDGTLLDAGRVVAPHGTPLLGVNLGRLGFMVDVLPAEMVTTIDEVLAGNYVREQRLLLSAHVEHCSGQSTAPVDALNDVVVRNRDFARVLDFDTYLDGEFISHHRADGLVVSTPTGSTAYALSGGGPVLHPGMRALALVPICPHTLSDRPLVVDAHHRVEIVVDPNASTEALFAADGQSNTDLSGGDKVCIEPAGHELTLLHPPDYEYFNILRNKLKWGRDQRGTRR